MHFSLSATPLFDMQRGEMVGAFEVFRDITDLHIYKETVKLQERGQIMLDAISLSCCLFNDTLEMIDCNQDALKFFQCFSKGEACAKAMQMFPEYQPNGRVSAEAIPELMRKPLTAKPAMRNGPLPSPTGRRFRPK